MVGHPGTRRLFAVPGRPSAPKIIEQALKVAVEATLAACRGVLEMTGEVLRAPIVPTLVDMSKEADMVVMGCRGQGAVERACAGIG